MLENPFLVVETLMVNQVIAFLKKTSFEGDAIENSASESGLHQLVKEPIHRLDTFPLSNDLVFTPAFHSSLNQKCHYQIVYGKFNLEIIYPPPYNQDLCGTRKIIILNFLDELLTDFIGKEPF